MICETVEGKEFITGQWTSAYDASHGYDINFVSRHYYFGQLGRIYQPYPFRIPKTITERYRTLEAFPICVTLRHAGWDSVCPLCVRYLGQNSCIIPCEECVGRFARDVKHVYFAIWVAHKVLGADVGSLVVAELIS